jgi:nucleotide-binding universal stress UspA family protein
MKILLAVDGSDASMPAVAATVALPTPRETTIEVISVVPDRFASEGSVWPNVIRVDPPTDRDRVLDDVARRLLAIAQRIRTESRTVQVCVLEGRPATEIVAEAARFGADLIVLGARGLSAVERLLIGSVSSEVVDHAPCAVLIARRGRVGSVLVATDGSSGARAAVDYLADCASFDEAEVHVVSVADPGLPLWNGISPVDGATSIEIYADAVEMSQTRARDAADEAVARLRDHRVAGVSVPRDEDVVSAIIKEADDVDADIVVVGARDIGRIHRWLVGSVSRAVLHLAAMSVLIVRPRVTAVTQREAATAVSA